MIAGDFYYDRFDLSERGEVLGTNWSLMPEVECAQKVQAFGTSERSLRLFLTFVSAMDRARDATRLWRARVRLFKLHPEVFEPDQVSSMSADTLTSLLSESGVSQRHGPDAEAWHRIACSLASGSGSVRQVVDSGNGDARELLKELRGHNNAGHSRFPMLRGPKIGPMWVRIMANPGGAKIAHIDAIPVAVDMRVRRPTENLGVTDTLGLQTKEAKQRIQSAWRSAVQCARIGGPQGIADTCAALDPALWFFGKHGCSHCERIGQRAPISHVCDNWRLPT